MAKINAEFNIELEYFSSSGSDSEPERVFAGEGDEIDDESAAMGVQMALYEPLVEDFEDRVAEVEVQVDESRLLNTDWCTCGRCSVEPSFAERDCVCCQEIPQVQAEAEQYNVVCITAAEYFEPAILNPLSLYIGWFEYTEKWRRDARSFGDRTNEKYRYVAYRKLVRWCWGWLGRNIRVQTPACAHSLIMREYPDGRNHYKGTILRPLNV